MFNYIFIKLKKKHTAVITCVKLTLYKHKFYVEPNSPVKHKKHILFFTHPTHRKQLC